MSAGAHFDKHRDFVVPANPPVQSGGVTLFDRLGGRPGISRLVKWFYARARYDEELEPIFRAHIHDWARHIPQLIDFWVRMTGGPSDYAGNLRGAHQHLALEARHFEVWLRWWERTCREVLANAPVEQSEMITLAQRLATQMQRPTGVSLAKP